MTRCISISDALIAVAPFVQAQRLTSQELEALLDAEFFPHFSDSKIDRILAKAKSLNAPNSTAALSDDDLIIQYTELLLVHGSPEAKAVVNFRQKYSDNYVFQQRALLLHKVHAAKRHLVIGE